MGQELAGKVVIVGLERADIGRRLAAEGATVVVVGEDAGAAGELLAEIEAAAGAGRAAYFRLGATPPAPTAPAPAPAAPAPSATRAVVPPAPAEDVASSRPTGSDLDGLVEFVAGMWPARSP